MCLDLTKEEATSGGRIAKKDITVFKFLRPVDEEGHMCCLSRAIELTTPFRSAVVSIGSTYYSNIRIRNKYSIAGMIFISKLMKDCIA
jgi:hypothetical protein